MSLPKHRLTEYFRECEIADGTRTPSFDIGLSSVYTITAEDFARFCFSIQLPPPNNFFLYNSEFTYFPFGEGMFNIDSFGNLTEHEPEDDEDQFGLFKDTPWKS